MSQAIIFSVSRPAGSARPRYFLPAATLSKENPCSWPSWSTTDSTIRSTPGMDSQLFGSFNAPHTAAIIGIGDGRFMEAPAGHGGKITESRPTTERSRQASSSFPLRRPPPDEFGATLASPRVAPGRRDLL